MNKSREIAEKLLRGFQAGLDPSIYNHERSVVELTAALEERERAGYERGMSEARELSVHGSAECVSCDSHSVTLYSKGRTCFCCRALAHKATSDSQRGENGEV